MIIGLTGRICSGKNYVGRLLALRGLEVWDLDAVASKIRNNMRTEVMNLLGTTDSQEIASIVFNDPSKLHALENLIYPVLEEKIRSYKYDLVINGALLHRSGFDRLCDFAIFVTAPQEVRRDRALKERGFDEKEFMRREQAQSDVDPALSPYSCPVATIENYNKKDSDLIADLDRILSCPPRF